MSIYLYVKTHKKTGLKYLGKTTESDPHSYRGSGVIWKHHIQKHGYDVFTEIIKECQTREELIYWGKYYSDLWNIVDSDEWANLKPEEGDGGAYFGHVMTPDTKKLQMEKAKNRKKQTCQHCGITCSINHIKRWHGDNCSVVLDPVKLEERKSKFRKEKIKCMHCDDEFIPCRYNELHGNNCSKNLFKIAEREKNRLLTLELRPEYECEYCGIKTKTRTNYIRWHGPKCKLIKTI